MIVDPGPLELHPVRIPMRRRFRRIDHREAILIRGPRGWGEFSPFPEYPAEVAARWLEAALESAAGDLPEPGRRAIPVNVTVPAVAPDAAAALAAGSGATTAKVKVGEPGDSALDDLARVRAVRDALGPEAKIRVDVNGAWDLDTACRRLDALAEVGLEYVEQPVSAIEDMAELRRRVAVKVAADESVRLADDPMEVVEREAADLLVLKVQPLGGVAQVLGLAARCGLPVVVSSALETSVGLYGGLLAASLLEDLPHACGLGTVSLLGGDVTFDPLVARRGVIDVRRPAPSAELLERWRPGDARRDELMRRFRAALRLLT